MRHPIDHLMRVLGTVGSPELTPPFGFEPATGCLKSSGQKRGKVSWTMGLINAASNAKKDYFEV
jgi:hypothetical protein